MHDDKHFNYINYINGYKWIYMHTSNLIHTIIQMIKWTKQYNFFVLKAHCPYFSWTSLLLVSLESVIFFAGPSLWEVTSGASNPAKSVPEISREVRPGRQSITTLRGDVLLYSTVIMYLYDDDSPLLWDKSRCLWINKRECSYYTFYQIQMYTIYRHFEPVI